MKHELKIMKGKELKTILGKRWHTVQVIGKVAYMAGIPPFDEILHPGNFSNTNSIINLLGYKDGFAVELVHKFKFHKLPIPKDHCVSMTFESKEDIIENQDKSVIGRAIVGGLLAGPVGAIIGGISGIGTKEVKLKAAETVLNIELSDGRFIAFMFDNKHLPAVNKFFSNYYVG